MENIVVATNRKAFHEYHILEEFEAGIQLRGSEVKSIREGKASLKQSYILIRRGEAWLRGAHIASYSHTGYEGHEPVRDRKLLLHKKEIIKLKSNTEKKGMTIIPLSIYLKGSWIKLTLGVGRGKKLHDKRQADKQKSIRKEINSALKR